MTIFQSENLRRVAIGPPRQDPAEIMVEIVGVTKRFTGRGGNAITAVESTNLGIRAGEFVTIVGPSGCGKSTLLNLISGLTRPSEGTLRFKGNVVRGVNRRIGYITQQDNLMPWRTLRDNVAFPLEIAGIPKLERYERTEAWLQRVGLEGFEDAYPHELSGGMRQRANIVRTLVYEPDVLLMDEPFGPLDAQTRLLLQDDLLDLWESMRKTILFVTHDLTEAIALADRVVLMSARPGRIVRIDEVDIPRPRDIFHIHDNARFRALYDDIWRELELQVRGSRGANTIAQSARRNQRALSQ
jgi:NitT/TauT family transport system ATP-binding protein